MKTLLNFVKTHRLETFILISILLLAAFLRFYRLPEYMTFLGDEGRDARVVRKIITDFDLVLIGPTTSVTTSAGHMYLGPLYYYLMVPAMLLSGLSPIGPAVMVALFSLATIILIWHLGRTWFHPIAGLTAAALYAISPTVITYSRSSWNPNIMPFFALLSIWSIYEIWQSYNSPLKRGPSAMLKRGVLLRFLVLSISLAFILQSHYLGLLLFPIIGIYWLISFVKCYMLNVKCLKPFLTSSLICLTVFAILMSPLLLFDLRHDWLNWKSFSAFFTERQTSVHFKFYKELNKIYPLLEQIYSSLLTAQNKLASKIIIIITALTTLISQVPKLSSLFRLTPPSLPLQKGRSQLFLLLTWFLIGILGLSIYNQHIYDHYFGFLFPVPFLLTGWAIWQLSSIPPLPKGRLGGVTLISLLIVSPLLYLNLNHHPFRFAPNQQLQRTQTIAKTIVENNQGQPFNLAMISKSNYDESYRFFLELWKTPLSEIEPARASETITNQLFVICENQPPFANPDENCEPINHPKSEIALFGWSKIDQTWEFPWGHKLYKLTHSSK